MTEKPTKKKGGPRPGSGRPRSLEPDEKTLQTIYGLGKIQATCAEIAAVLGVVEDTYLAFRKRHPEVQQIYDEGSGQGKVSLRRRQIKTSKKSPAMQIWLGKQQLGQKDKAEVTGGMIATVVMSDTDAKL